MPYESPITVYEMPPEFCDIESLGQKIVKEIDAERERQITLAVRMHVDVDKDELIRALNYDRGQYDKGYRDGYNAGYEAGREKLHEYLMYLVEMLDALEDDGLIRRLVLFEEEI